MNRLFVFCAGAGLMLGSAAAPSQRPPEPPRLDYHLPQCMSLSDHCAALTIPPEPAPGLAKAAAAPPEKPAKARAEESKSKSDAAVKRSGSKGAVKVVISIPQQKIYVFKGSELIATSPVSTGKRGHETPVGTFPILQKKVRHHSNKYDNAPMPYMQRLTWYGIALHAGALPGYPASHGCIRMPRSFAKKLYGLTDFSTRVTITNAKPKSPEAALDLV